MAQRKLAALMLVACAMAAATPGKSPTGEAPGGAFPVFPESATTAPGSIPLTRDAAKLLFDRFDYGLASMVMAADAWRLIPGWPTDFRKATVATDVANYALPDSVRATLKQQRQDAQQQFDGSDWPGAVVAITKANATLTQTVQNFSAVVYYWRNRPALDALLQNWEHVLAQNHLEDNYSSQFRAVLAKLNGDASQGRFVDIAGKDLPALMDQYGSAVRAARYAKGGSLIDDPLRPAGVLVCKDAEDTGTPLLGDGERIAARVDVLHSAPSDNYYPPYARRLGAQGVTTLRALVTGSGCVVWAEVVRTSGYISLDEASLKWATHAAVFTPGTLGKVPVQSLVAFNVRFRLIP